MFPGVQEGFRVLGLGLRVSQGSGLRVLGLEATETCSYLKTGLLDLERAIGVSTWGLYIWTR